MANIIEVLGWSLLHAIWQVTFIAMLLALVLRVVPQKMSEWRYVLSLSAMLLCLISFVATMIIVQPTMITNAVFSNNINPSLSWQLIGVVSWGVGVIAMLGQQCFHHHQFMTKQKQDRFLPENSIIQAIARLKTQFGIWQKVDVFMSSYVKGPCTYGTIKPVILLPISLVTHLSTQEIEAVLAHEMAHIKRYDYLVNLAVVAIRAIFFFHPAMHFIVKNLQTEREFACDALACDVLSKQSPAARKDLATGLGKLAMMQADLAPSLAMQALSSKKPKGPVAQRMYRLVGQETSLNMRQDMLRFVIALSMVFMLLGGSMGLNFFQKAQAADRLVSEEQEQLPQNVSASLLNSFDWDAVKLHQEYHDKNMDHDHNFKTGSSKKACHPMDHLEFISPKEIVAMNASLAKHQELFDDKLLIQKF